MNRYLNVLRNAAYLLSAGFWRSLADLRRAARTAQSQGKTLHVIIMMGGLGDIIAADPTIRALIRPDEHVVVLARPSYLSAFAFNPHVHEVIRADAYAQAILLRKFFRPARWSNLHVDGHMCNMFQIPIRNPNLGGVDTSNYFSDKTLADVYALVAFGARNTDPPRIYADPDFDAASYVAGLFGSMDRPLLVIHTQATEAIRRWPPACVQETINAVQAMLPVNVIEMGLDPVLRETANIKQPRGALNLPQQMALMRQATAFLGVESGFAHIANALTLPALYLLPTYKKFGDYLPWHLSPAEAVLRSPGDLTALPAKVIAEHCFKILQ